MKRISHLTYRIKQFNQALQNNSHTVDTGKLFPYLTPAQLTLFRRLQPSEQWHALAVLKEILGSGHSNPDLLTAALLHDIGKIHYPLGVWERVLIVIVYFLNPKLAIRWGREKPRGLSKPFAVACHHAEWGADLAEHAGASAITVNLIRRHEEPVSKNSNSRQDRLLRLLQQADDTN